MNRRTITLGAEAIPELEGLAMESRIQPLRYLANISPEACGRWWLDEIRSTVGKSGAILLASVSEEVDGFALCIPLPWERQVLGKRMAGLNHLAVRPGVEDREAIARGLVEAAVESERERGTECVVSKIFTTDVEIVHAVESLGFRLMDTLLQFTCSAGPDGKLDVVSEGSGEMRIRRAIEADVPELRGLAHRSFSQHFGRFHADPRIGRDAATHLYEEWIESCCKGWADWVFVLESEGALVGYSAWKKPSETELRQGISVGHFSIAGIDPAMAGRGCFGSLVRAGMATLLDTVDCIAGPTHVNNYGVHRGYRRLGGGWSMPGTRSING